MANRTLTSLMKWIIRRNQRRANRSPEAAEAPTKPVVDTSASEVALSARDDDGVSGPILIHALDGFLGAGSASKLAAEVLHADTAEVIHRFDVDRYYDYRARRPAITFDADHYTEYVEPSLELRREWDTNGREFYLLAGPEPDFGWERFVSDVQDVIDDLGISLTLGIAAVPMGVPHTRPMVITAHGVRPELVDRSNLWSTQVQIPSSAQALLEYRLGQENKDAAGYVVHVPHYLSQIEFPTAALALIDAVMGRTGLSFDDSPLRNREESTLNEIAKQIEEQDGGELLSGLEEQYDSFTRGAAASLLADDESLPSGDEIARQFEQFLAARRDSE